MNKILTHFSRFRGQIFLLCLVFGGVSFLSAQSEIECPTNITISNDSGICEAFVEVIAIINGTPCANPNPINNSPYDSDGGLDASGFYPVGETTVVFSICDGQFLCSTVVTVTDVEAPTCIADDLIIYLDENGEASIVAEDILISSIDNCDLVTDIDITDFTCSDIGAPVVVTLTVTDPTGNMSTCSGSVTVNDTIVPVADAAPDVIVQLAPNACEIAVPFTFPAATDNCDPAPLVTAIPGQPASGDIFPSGTTEVMFMVEDAYGNSSLGSLNVIVNEYIPIGLACITDLNLSIDAYTCQSIITAEMVLQGTQFGCVENCIVTAMNEDLTERPNFFTSADVGKSFMYQVCCGDLCCMGSVHVEDKTPPQIMCVNDTITCAELVSFTPPFVTENCSVANIKLLNETIEEVACDNPELSRIITRTYQATDIAGNVSNICSQELSISKFDIGTVMPPLTQEFNIECAPTYAHITNGIPDPIWYGSPRLGGQNLWPDQFLVCNLFVDYEDMTLPTSNNTISIVRTWTATNWVCGQDTSRQFVQIFNIRDTQGPIISCPGNLTFSTSGFECSTIVDLPAIPISDICGDVVNVNVDYNGGFLINSNGGQVTIPAGVSTVTYFAYDSNGNSSSCSFQVNIQDLEQPIPVCELNTVVSLTNDGIAIVDAAVFDDGSFDACGPVTFQVRRMNPTCDADDIFFGESVTFCCADMKGEQMVVLRVTDQGGLFNECMVTATVQDKIPPILVQGLPDITLSCEYPFNTMDTEQFGSIVMDVDDREEILLAADVVIFGGEAKDGLVLGNCIELISDEFTFSNINSCHIGTATRILTFANAQGLTVTDVQILTFVNPSPFVKSDANFPDDITLFNVCDIDAILPDNLPLGFDYPTFIEDGCDQVGFTYEDTFIDLSNGAQSCYKVIRTWILADWCQKVNGQFVTFEDDQEIVVRNTIAPVISGDCSNRTQCSFDPNCGPAFVELINDGSDDCTGDAFLKWSYTIDAFSDGSIDIVGFTNNASGSYPPGIHTITWTLDDQCNNVDMCSYTFEVQNCKAPTPICIDNLTTEISPMDLDGDGIPDTERVMITPDFFDAKSSHPCGTPVTLSFSSDVNDQLRIFGCDDIGLQPIELWVTGINGNQDFCITSLDVQNNQDAGLCPVTLVYDIMGELKTESNEMISQGLVTLIGGEAVDMTEEDGQYEFMQMVKGSSLTISPSKTTDAMNGITTLDIILIQKHILGLELLNSPYKLIAADVNHSDNISGADIIQLRKLILGHYVDFPNNTSWRFVEAGHNFIDNDNPWASEIPEVYQINDFNSNLKVDFRGVKIGDVNGSVTPNQVIGQTIDTRSDEALKLEIAKGEFNKGESQWIPVYAQNFENIIGFQLGLAFAQNIDLLGVRGAALNLDESNYKVDFENNSVSVVWHSNASTTFRNDEALFEILVEAKESVISYNIASINDEVLMSESYNESLQRSTIEITTRGNATDVEESIFEVSMSQNEPNPWLSSTVIHVTSSENHSASLKVMDITGKTVLERSVDIQKGQSQIQLMKSDLPSTGVLYYELSMRDMKLMKKMVLIK